MVSDSAQSLKQEMKTVIAGGKEVKKTETRPYVCVNPVVGCLLPLHAQFLSMFSRQVQLPELFVGEEAGGAEAPEEEKAHKRPLAVYLLSDVTVG
ncbi:hypothetical protein MHYP_G00135490 [Metynnis hypsauchen]